MEVDRNVGDPLPSPAVTNNPPEHTLTAEKWKHRPPYYTQLSQGFGEVKWRGYCQCRKISYSLKGEPIKATFCHARNTQVLHGAPFVWAVIFDKNDVSFDNGSVGLSFISALSDTPTNLSVSCEACHTPIMHEGQGTTCSIFPSLIEFEGSFNEQRSQRDPFKPKYVYLY